MIDQKGYMIGPAKPGRSFFFGIWLDIAPPDLNLLAKILNNGQYFH